METSSPAAPSDPTSGHDSSRDHHTETTEPRLGLRPTRYAVDGAHPDQRPCPAWCWARDRNGPHQHEIVAEHPMVALHHLDEIVRTIASLYPGSGSSTSAPSGLHHAATIESDLTQLGSDEPVITVALRRWEGHRSRHTDLMSLTVTDATELATVLDHFVHLAGHPPQP
jgi:hypothetical protein